MEIENLDQQGGPPSRSGDGVAAGAPNLPRRKSRAGDTLRRKRGGKGILLLLPAVGLGAVACFLFLGRRVEQTAPSTDQVVTVGVAKVTRQGVYKEVPIPAEFRPHVQAQLHAIVTGYVSKMFVDFGDKVKQGQVLATLNVPELQDELNSAKASQQQAEADYNNAHLLYTRLEQVNKEHPKLVAQQDLDTARSKDANSAAAVAAAKSKVGELETRVSYTQIVAPFDGVVTQRSVDPGALVQAGTSSDRSPELLQVSDNYHLRLDFPVSVEYVQAVRVGMVVHVKVDSLHGKLFTGKITRFQNEVNGQTRTMNTEIELDNPDLEIVPGMYAVVLFRYSQEPSALTIPTEAVSNPKNPDVFLVDADHKIQLRPVKLGVEMPDQFEVKEGLQEGDLVMMGNRSQVKPGQRVEVKLVGQPSVPLPPSSVAEPPPPTTDHSTPAPLDSHAATSTPPSAVPDKP